MTVFEADAVGVLEVLSWVKELSQFPLIVEPDSLLVVKALQKQETN